MRHKDLLEKVIKDRLTLALSDDVGSESEKENFKEAMEAIDRAIELEKIEQAKEEQVKNRVIKYIEIAAIPAALMTLDFLFKRKYMKDVCNFEKDYTFTTTPGRSISSFFRFKK